MDKHSRKDHLRVVTDTNGEASLTLFEHQHRIDWHGTWQVKQVNRASADAWFGRYHYTGTSGTAGGKVFGVYAGDAIAMVALGPTANKDGVAKKYGLQDYNGNIEIVRVAVHPDAPKNAASRTVASVLRHVAKYWQLDWVFSYADTGQGHHGGIYQALNAVYVGLSPPERGYELDGQLIHPRSVVSKFGTRAWPQVRDIAEQRGHTISQVDDANTAKHTYILPIGGPATRRQIRTTLEPHARPYPKRTEDAA